MLASCSKRCSSIICSSARRSILRAGFATAADDASSGAGPISQDVLIQSLVPGKQSKNPFRDRGQTMSSLPSSSNAGKSSKRQERGKFDDALSVTTPFLLSANCGSNNAIFTLRWTEKRKTYAQVSGGMCKFKNAARGSYEAGYQCAVRMFKAIAQAQTENPSQDVKVEIRLKGRGMAREALLKALTTPEGDAVRKCITRLTDVTPIKIGGARAKKAKRL